jgi:hypothetical protein
MYICHNFYVINITYALTGKKFHFIFFLHIINFLFFFQEKTEIEGSLFVYKR